MIVVDTSAIVAVLAVDVAVPRLRQRLANDDWHAPHLIDVEFLHAIRRMLLTGLLDVQRAQIARAHFSELQLTRYPQHRLSDRIWELRNNVTPYDAGFVALSEALEVPLITCDTGLAAAPGHSAKIELYANG